MTDLISRQVALDALDRFSLGQTDAIKLSGQMKHYLEHLPSAQPKYDEWCDDCKEYDKERHCCPRWNRVIRQTVEDMKAAQPGWIPVTERLPEDVKIGEEYPTVIFCTKDAVYAGFFEHYLGGNWWAAEDYTVDNVIAWMPLPEPARLGD